MKVDTAAKKKRMGFNETRERKTIAICPVGNGAKMIIGGSKT
jgi:hypothetical protein